MIRTCINFLDKKVVIKTNVWHNSFGTFNSWVVAELQNEGRRYNEQEGFVNFFSSNSYLPISIITFYSISLKKKIT